MVRIWKGAEELSGSWEKYVIIVVLVLVSVAVAVAVAVAASNSRSSIGRRDKEDATIIILISIL